MTPSTSTVVLGILNISDRALSGEAATAELESDAHPLARVFAACHDLVTELQSAAEQGPRRARARPFRRSAADRPLGDRFTQATGVSG